jgi:hypothetical protein
MHTGSGVPIAPRESGMTGVMAMAVKDNKHGTTTWK